MTLGRIMGYNKQPAKLHRGSLKTNLKNNNHRIAQFLLLTFQ